MGHTGFLSNSVQQISRTFFLRFAFSTICFLVCCSHLFPLSVDRMILLESIGADKIEAKPNTILSLSFRVTNRSGAPHRFINSIKVPSDWTQIIEEPPFELHDGGKKICIISVKIPLSVQAGTYNLVFRSEADDRSGIIGEKTVVVKILTVTGIKIHIVEAPFMAISGDIYHVRFSLSNGCNLPVRIGLNYKISGGGATPPEDKELKLGIGKSSLQVLRIQTDAENYSKKTQILSILATVLDFPDLAVSDSAFVRLDLIPQISGQKDYYHRAPAELTFIGLADGQAGSSGQIGLSGSTLLDDKSKHKVVFLARTRGPDNLISYGYRQENFNIRYSNPVLNFEIGDRIFRLSKLSEFGNFGSGIYADFRLKDFFLKGYSQTVHFVSPKQRQNGLQLAYANNNKHRFSLNYLKEKKDEGTTAGIITLAAAGSPK